MNFQELKNVEKADIYLDMAFRAARTKEKPKIVGKADKLKLVKTNEYQNIQTVTRSLSKNLSNITASFPVLDRLPEFYKELVYATLDYPKLKKSLGAVKWAESRVQSLFQSYGVRIKKATMVQKIKGLRKEFYGRVSSILKQIDGELKYIEDSRRSMKRFPTIKQGLLTIAISGYPNVGKSSLLKALTTSNPEIKDYAFTTKSINIGYLKDKNTKIQLVDTPGAFDRELDDMNPVEKQSYLVLKHVADLIFFVIDPTERCGYDVSQQKQLLDRVKTFNKEIVILYSKSDLIKEREKDRFYISTITNEGLDGLTELAKKHKSN